MDFSTASELLLCSDGKIIVMGAGYSFSDPTYNPVCLAMLTSSGQPDLSFGTNGTVKIGFYGKHEMAAAITLDNNSNAIITGASTDTSDSENVPVIGRFSNFSDADSSFGGTGKLVIDLAAGLQSLRSAHLAGGVAFDVLLLSDGALLVCGSFAADGFVAKLLPGGSLDTSFSNDGFVLFQAEQQYNNVINKMIGLPDGAILLGITSDKNYDRDFYIAKLDASSGNISGVEFVDNSGYEDMLSDIVLTPQGAAVMAGRCIKPANALTPGYRSDYFSITVCHDAELLSLQNKILVQYDPLYQSGANAVAAQSDGTIICAGFTNTAVASETKIALVAIDPSYYLSVNDLAKEDNSIAYPNPASDWVTIIAEKGAILTLSNSLGEIILSMIAEENETIISLENISQGVYFLSIEKDDLKKTVKVVRN